MKGNDRRHFMNDPFQTGGKHMKFLSRLTLFAAFALAFALAPLHHAAAQDSTLTISQQVGFDDPVFAELEAKNQRTLGESVEFNAYGHDYRLFTVWELLPDMTADDPGGVLGGTALLFQMDTAAPTLLWSEDYAARIGQEPYVSGEHFGGGFNSPPPGDWNGDGVIEFGVLGSFSGTAWFNTILYIYELQADNTVTSALEGVIPPGMIVTHVEQGFDGQPLLSVSDIRGEMAMNLPNCCGPHTQRYFAWRDGQLTDVSNEHQEKYNDPLGGAVLYLTTQTVPAGADDLDARVFAARLLELLMTYDALKQRDAGWALAQNLLAQAKQTGRLSEGTYVDTEFMPAMEQLYQSGQQFVPPDIIISSGSALGDFYGPGPVFPQV
jgi:hypothetical protein